MTVHDHPKWVFTFREMRSFTVKTGRNVAVTRIEWVGASSSNLLPGITGFDDFFVRFFHAENGAPDEHPFADLSVEGLVSEVATGFPTLSFYSAEIPRKVILNDDDSYFLSIAADTSALAEGHGFWTWFFLEGPTSFFTRQFDDQPWLEASPRSYSFRITGQVVPEPTALLLLGIGLLSLVLSRLIHGSDN